MPKYENLDENVSLTDVIVEESHEKEHNWRKIEPIPTRITSKWLIKTVQTPKIDLLWVDPSSLIVDGSYQRSVSGRGLDTIRKIVENWSWLEFKPPIVVRVKDSLHIIDGQHTSIAATSHPDIKTIPVFCVDEELVREARALAFVGQNTTRTNVSKVSVFKARYDAGDEVATGVVMALRRAKVQLNYNASKTSPPATSDVESLMRLYKKYGVVKLADILVLCVKANQHPIKGFVVTAVGTLKYDKSYTDDEIITLLKAIEPAELEAQIIRLDRKTVSKPDKAVIIFERQYKELVNSNT